MPNDTNEEIKQVKNLDDTSVAEDIKIASEHLFCSEKGVCQIDLSEILCHDACLALEKDSIVSNAAAAAEDVKVPENEDKKEEANDEKQEVGGESNTSMIARKIFHFVNYIIFLNWFLYFIDTKVDCLFVEKLIFFFFILKSSSYIYKEYLEFYLDKLFNFYFVGNTV